MQKSACIAKIATKVTGGGGSLLFMFTRWRQRLGEVENMYTNLWNLFKKLYYKFIRISQGL